MEHYHCCLTSSPRDSSALMENIVCLWLQLLLFPFSLWICTSTLAHYIQTTPEWNKCQNREKEVPPVHRPQQAYPPRSASQSQG